MPAQFPNPDPASATPPATPFDSILAQCRDLVCERLSGALSGMLDKVDESLTAAITEARDANAKKLYANTRDKVLAQRESIEKQFKTRYLREFQRRVNRVKKIGDSFAEIDLSSLELELVGEEDLEESLKFNAMAARLRQYCDEELVALDQRVGVLLGDADLQSEDNPLTPQAICDAYKDTCRQVDPDVAVRMVLLKLFDDHVADEIRAVYKAVNALLVQNSILPKIRIAARKEPARQQPPAPAAEAPKALAQAEKPAEGEQDLFAILKNLRANALPAAPQGGGPVAAGAGAPGPVIQGSELLGLLTRIQLGDASVVKGAVLPMAAPGVDPGMANILRELKTSSVGTGMNQLDMMTLDIMSLVFDQLFDDPKIPVGAKGLIGRLQIPMLKVAIADKTFFSKKGHPARQVLDTLGEISLRLSADFNAASPVFRRIEIILQGLIDGFADKMEIFDAARGELEKVLKEENQRAEQQAQRAAKEIEQKERLALAKTIAQAEIRARARTANVPVPVLEFLIQHWVQVLLIVHVVDGEDSEAWKTALESMDLLIWSVEPKQTAEDKRELKAIIPELLQGLAAGLKLVGAEEAIRSGFFTDLKQLHDEILGAPALDDTVEMPVRARDASDTVQLPVPDAAAAGADAASAQSAPAEQPVRAAHQEPVAAPTAVPPVQPVAPTPAIESAGAGQPGAPAAAQSELIPDLDFGTPAAPSIPALAQAQPPAAGVGAAETIPALMPDLDFGTPVTADIPASAGEQPPAAGVSAAETIPALIPDLDFDRVPSPAEPARAAEAPSPVPPPAVPEPSAPAASPVLSLDFEFTAPAAARAPTTPVPEPAAASLLPDLEFEPVPGAPTLAASPTPPSAPPAEPTFVLNLEPVPEAPQLAPPAAPAEFVSLPVAEAAPAQRAASDALPDLDFAIPPPSAPAPAAARPAQAGSPAMNAPPATPARGAPPGARPAAPASQAPATAKSGIAAQRPAAPPTAGRSAHAAGAAPQAPGGQQSPAAAARPAAPRPAQPGGGPAAPRPAQPAAAPRPAPGGAPVARPAAAPAARPGAAPAVQRSAAAPAPGSAPRPASAAGAPAQRSTSSLDFTAPVTVKNPFGEGKVEVQDLDFTVKPAAGTGAKSEAAVAELPPNLKVGTWVGIRGKNEKEARKSAKLSFISPLKTRFLFVDKQGKTTLDCSRAELARRFHTGEVVFMDTVPEVPLFDRLTEGLVGKLGGSAKAKS